MSGRWKLLAGGCAAHEKPSFFSDGYWSNAIFYPLGVYFELAVVEIDVEPVTQCQGVVDGLAQQALEQRCWGGRPLESSRIAAGCGG